MRTATDTKIGYLLHGERRFARDQSLFEALQDTYTFVHFYPPRGSYISQIQWLYNVVKTNADLRWIAGYQCHRLVPWLRLFSGKPVIYNALCSLYEGSVLDRHEPNPFKRIKIWLIDFIAFSFSKYVFVETWQQISFLSRTFFQRSKKFTRVFTGLPQHWSASTSHISSDTFHCVFRGGLQPYLGLETLLGSIKRLSDAPIRWTLIGRGPLQSWLEKELVGMNSSKVTLRTEYLAETELREILQSADVALGPVSDHPRAHRTIPNKIFEYLAVGIPIVASSTESLQELLADHHNALLIEPGSAEALAMSIEELRNKKSLRDHLAVEGQKTFTRTCSPTALKLVLEPVLKAWLKDA